MSTRSSASSRLVASAAALALAVAGSAASAIAATGARVPSRTTVECLEVNLVNETVPCYGQALYGEPIALEFAVSTAAGPVQGTGSLVIYLDGVPLLPIAIVDGKGTRAIEDWPPITGLLPGRHELAGHYLGTAGVGDSWSPVTPMTVIPVLANVFTFVGLNGPQDVTIPRGTALPLTMHVATSGVLPASGTIQLIDVATGVPRSVPLSLDGAGQARVTLTFDRPGTFQLCASYGGDPRYEAVHCFQGPGVIDPFSPPVTVNVLP